MPLDCTPRDDGDSGDEFPNITTLLVESVNLRTRESRVVLKVHVTDVTEATLQDKLRDVDKQLEDFEPQGLILERDIHICQIKNADDEWQLHITFAELPLPKGTRVIRL